MLTLAYIQKDAALAARLQKDLEAAGQTVTADLQPGLANILIVLVSPTSVTDTAVKASIVQALDNTQHIIPVLTAPTVLPKMIDHLQPLDFSTGYPFSTLTEQIAILSAPGARLPLKVRTPSVNARNRGTAVWLVIFAVISFIVGIVLVGFYGIQAPREEYNGVDTEVAATVQMYLRTNIPRSTEDAINFPATVQAAPTSQRPFLVETATAQVTTPTPEE